MTEPNHPDGVTDESGDLRPSPEAARALRALARSGRTASPSATEWEHHVRSARPTLDEQEALSDLSRQEQPRPHQVGRIVEQGWADLDEDDGLLYLTDDGMDALRSAAAR